MGQLTITFSGICTHFHNCIPSGVGDAMIPMRSVLPNALGVHFGMVQRPQNVPQNVPSQPAYFLMPHIAVVADAATTPPATLSSFLYGARLQVLNVDETQPPFTFVGDGYHLPHYVPNGLLPSQTVVQDYNAACYVDFFYGVGRVKGNKNVPSSNLTTVVTMDTLGDPVVRITPFPGSLMAATDPWTVNSETLFVSNQDFDVSSEDSPFDFMLNYLTTSPGIPQLLTQNSPGMGSTLDELTPPILTSKMNSLSGAIGDIGSVFPINQNGTSSVLQSLASIVLQGPVPLDESCSDSHYP